MKAFLANVRDDYRDWAIGADMENGYRAQSEVNEKPLRINFFCYARDFAAGWLTYKLCEWRGHKMVDDSYGGPDSGCMAGHCERCGFTFHHTLY